jgi:tripartite-type tricarboxylate transporter receptor subunit TctC
MTMPAVPLVALFAVTVLSASGPVLAQAPAYPSQPVRVIVPFPPGGGTDVLTRLLVNKIAATTKWSFVVDNKPGAGGNIGLDAAAKARNDGYTLAMGQTANLAINPTLYPKMPYDAGRDFAPIMLVAAQSELVVVRQDSPFRSLADLVAAARAKPGTVTMASSGSGTVTHLAGEMFGKRAGVQFVHVPYKGAAPALTDVLGGQTDFTIITPPSVMAMIKAGKARALAATGLKRLPALPDVPTIHESGYPGFEAIDWKALVAPAGTPVAVLERLNVEANKALADPELVKRLAEEGSEARGGTVQQFADFLAGEQRSWSAAVRESGAKVD